MYLHPPVRPLASPPPNLSNTIGKAARGARLRAHLTQVEVAQRVELSPTVYSRLERGRMLPSVPTLYRLCSTLSITPNEILGYATRTRPGESASARSQLLHQVHCLGERQAEALLQLLLILR